MKFFRGRGISYFGLSMVDSTGQKRPASPIEGKNGKEKKRKAEAAWNQKGFKEIKVQ